MEVDYITFLELEPQTQRKFFFAIAKNSSQFQCTDGFGLVCFDFMAYQTL